MAKKVVKSAIAPIQMWLMSQGRCVGCGRPLGRGKHSKHSKGTKVICECGRIFIQNKKTGKHRRALLSEV